MDDKVTQIFLDRILKTIEETGTLPWERPFNSLCSFNYFSMHEYTGINRWILPPGEYVTANQINQFNKQTGKNLRYQKGIKWYPVFFVKDDMKEISVDELPEELRSKYSGEDKFLGYVGYYFYVVQKGVLYRCKKVRRFYNVTEINYLEGDNGFRLPSKVASGEVTLTFTKPNEIIDRYINREGIRVTHNSDGAYYIPALDTINVPDLSRFTSEGRYYSTWFHEMSHSTGADGRLCRVGVAVSKENERKEIARENTRKYSYSMEECIAELSCALLCREAGIQAESTSDDVYKNHVAYIQGWMKYFKSNKDDIIWTMSCAEKAYQYVLNGNPASQDTGSAPIK